LSVISQDLVGESVTLVFSNANPLPTPFVARGRKGGVNSIEDRFEPTKLKKSGDVRFLTVSKFKRSETSKGVGGKMIQKEDNVEET
jgi:hypothetical protein